MSDGNTRSIRVQYYASLREERGIEEDILTTSANTALELYDELCRRFGFSLPVNSLTLAINDEFSTWNVQLEDNDIVIFIPPVAGG